ncbi:MAG TPA: hypothetical protein VNM92_07500 [Thermoanaerobaculia bacterium]|nr:hypothetical protein [Thermoanaerobaculia bacterium]
MTTPDEQSFPYQSALSTAVIGLESEFFVYIDGEEIVPETYWKQPSAFIDQPLLKRSLKAFQLPTGGAVYFDGGVIEVVTPGIEIGPNASAQVVRNLWDQIAFVRDQLTRWGKENGKDVRLTAFGTHYNISFELPREERSKDRTIQKLALLLAHVLPMPVILIGGNRRSTGIGVRPRRNRIEVTLDFTPDPGLMVATASLILGIVRDIMSWPSYRIEVLDEVAVPVPGDVKPGRHTTRKGWLTKDYHFPQSPFTCDVNEAIWKTRSGEVMSLREIASRTAWFFRDSIRRYSDPFSFRLLFSILWGQTPSMLELADRPQAYEDVGHAVRWGTVIPELANYRGINRSPQADEISGAAEIDEHLASRKLERDAFAGRGDETEPDSTARDLFSRERAASSEIKRKTLRRTADFQETLSPPWSGEGMERRERPPRAAASDRRVAKRRLTESSKPLKKRLSRSNYEKVFLKLASGGQLRIGSETLVPISMKGWYHAVFRRESDGTEQEISIDQLVKNLNQWS